MELVRTADYGHADPAVTEMFNKGQVESERIVIAAQAFITLHVQSAFGSMSDLVRKRFIQVNFPGCYPGPEDIHSVLPTRGADGKPTNAEIGTKIGKDDHGIGFDTFASLCMTFGRESAATSLQAMTFVSELRCFAIHYEQLKSEESSISDLNLGKFKFDKDSYKVMRKFSDLMGKLDNLDLAPKEFDSALVLSDKEYASDVHARLKLYYYSIRERQVSRWSSILSRCCERLTQCIPPGWESYTLVSPSKDAIVSRILNNPHRRDISKLWTSMTAWMTALKTALSTVGLELNEGVSFGVLDELLLKAKVMVGVAAATQLIYVDSVGATAADLKEQR